MIRYVLTAGWTGGGQLITNAPVSFTCQLASTKPSPERQALSHRDCTSKGASSGKGQLSGWERQTRRRWQSEWRARGIPLEHWFHRELGQSSGKQSGIPATPPNVVLHPHVRAGGVRVRVPPGAGENVAPLGLQDLVCHGHFRSLLDCF